MLSVSDAFDKFKSRLELSSTEQQDASSRQQRIRKIIDDAFDVEDDFLTGSYRRHTKTKPLKDVDIFIVLSSNENHYLDKPPDDVLVGFKEPLVEKYGEDYVEIQRRSVRVDFGVQLVDELSDKIMSFDVTPAFKSNGHYTICDRADGNWMQTNPKVHATLATEANNNFEGHWMPLVKMLKKWNEHHDKPIKPSFLIEVMSLDLLANWDGSYPRESKAWFATAIDAIDETWEDPAGLGHPVSDRISRDSGLLETAKTALKEAEALCTEAINHEHAGRTGDALDTWQALFGLAFAKS